MLEQSLDDLVFRLTSGQSGPVSGGQHSQQLEAIASSPDREGVSGIGGLAGLARGGGCHLLGQLEEDLPNLSVATFSYQGSVTSGEDEAVQSSEQLGRWICVSKNT